MIDRRKQGKRAAMAAMAAWTAWVVCAGCDKKQPATPAAVPSAAAAATPDSPEVTAVLGCYEITRDIPNDSGHKLTERLTLLPGGAARFQQTAVDTRKPGPPKYDDIYVGTFTISHKKVVATFTSKNGQPIDNADPKRVTTFNNRSEHQLGNGSSMYRWTPLPAQPS